MIRLVAALLFSVSGIAIAAAEAGHGPRISSGDWDDHKGFSEHRVRAPEIDLSSAMSALTLLAGGLVVLRGRKSG